MNNNLKFWTFILGVYFLMLSFGIFCLNGIVWQGMGSYACGVVTVVGHILTKKPKEVLKWEKLMEKN